jgi:uroporphyrinogen decarboxylase
MTKRERFQAFANFRAVDRVPRHASYTPHMLEKMTEHLGQSPLLHFDMDTGAGAGLLPPAGFVAPDYSVYHAGRQHGEDGFTIDGHGCGHVDHGFYHFTEYISPMAGATRIDELEQYPIPSRAGWLDADMIKAAEAAHAAGAYTQIFVGHMYENAWQVRGYVPFLEDLLLRRDWAELVLDKFCDNNEVVAKAAGKAGYDCIATGDDVANQNALMFQPELWRQVMKPRWARVIAAARAHKPDIHVWYHSDGNIWDILDDLVEIGVTILNPVQPECMDLLAIRRRFGEQLAFDGCVGTQTTFPFGSAQDMRDRVQELGETLDGKAGGLMLAPTHVLEPEVPAENVVAFFEASDEI